MEISSDFVMDLQGSNYPLIKGHVPSRVSPNVPNLGAGSIRDFEHHRALG